MKRLTSGRAVRATSASSNVLRDVEQQIGLAPQFAYECLLDMARPWVHRLPLVHLEHHVGSQVGDPAATAEYTWVRPSAFGDLVLASEVGQAAPFPFDLVVGTFHLDGVRAPFDPARVARAVAETADQSLGVAGFTAALGRPMFVTGSAVEFTPAQLAATGECEMSITGRLDYSVPGGVRVHSLPPDSDYAHLFEFLRSVQDADWGDVFAVVEDVDFEASDVDEDGIVLRYREEPPNADDVERGLQHHGYRRTGSIKLSQTVTELAQHRFDDRGRDGVQQVARALSALVTERA